VPMIICKPFRFSIMEWKVFLFIIYLHGNMCVIHVLWRFGNKLHFKDTQIFNSKACVKLIQRTKCFDLEFRFNGWSTCIVKSKPYKWLISIKGETEIDIEKWLINISL
jgi:hypothetical protein